jgi:hypothetical protein
VSQRALTLVSLLTFSVAWAGAQERPSPEAYVFSYFTGNGADGLHLASSDDGLRFTALQGGRSFLTPAVGGKLMRDPSITAGPDGTYHMVWTSGWWDRGIGIAHSKDLVTWSAQEWLPVMEHEPKALNCWAPEIFHDEPTGQYLIFWATTIPGRFTETEAFGDETKEKGARLNHRIYSVSTRDFREYTKASLFYDEGFNVIDATLVRDGERYALVVKDETRYPEAKKHLRIAFGPRAAGPFSAASPPVSPDWVEGPSMLRVAGRWMLYFDEYTRKRYGAARSADLRNFDQITEGLEFPAGARHGSVFTAPRSLVERLKAAPGSGPDAPGISVFPEPIRDDWSDH